MVLMGRPKCHRQIFFSRRSSYLLPWGGGCSLVASMLWGERVKGLEIAPCVNCLSLSPPGCWVAPQPTFSWACPTRAREGPSLSCFRWNGREVPWLGGRGKALMFAYLTNSHPFLLILTSPSPRLPSYLGPPLLETFLGSAVWTGFFVYGTLLWKPLGLRFPCSTNCFLSSKNFLISFIFFAFPSFFSVTVSLYYNFSFPIIILEF